MRNILLVEDEKMIRYGIYVMIENSGVPFRTITECRNGKEALECILKEKYDLVLTDIRMPGMDGLELAEWMHSHLEPENIPLIVAVSGYSEFEYVKKMLKFRAVDYLLKPVDREELYKVLWHVEKILRDRGVVNAEETAKENTELTSVSRRKMQQAIDYIRKNYRSPIDMAEVSNHVSMNYSMFSATFKEYTGENFSSYIKKLRIKKAMRLLDKTDLGVGEIAREVGFEDARRFAKVFKEENGCTPTAYREEYQQRKNDT